MKTTAPASPIAQRAPQTLTLDMDLPPAPSKRTRKASVPEAPVETAPLVKKNAAKKPLPAAVKPQPLVVKPLPIAVKPTGTGKTKTPAPTPPAVRVEREMALEGGRLWRMSGRHAVAYVQNASLASALLAVEPKHLARRAMAVYYDKKGRAIAWQVRFDTQHWDDVMRQLG